MIKGKVIEITQRGFKIDSGSQIGTWTKGLKLDLAVGEEVSITGIPTEGGNVFLASTISVYRSGQWIEVEDKPRSSATEVTNKSEDVETQTPADPFQSVNSIPVSVVHSKGGGTSIQHFERLDDGTRRLMYVADAFPRRRKINLFVLVEVSCLLALLALIGAIVYWFFLR